MGRKDGCQRAEGMGNQRSDTQGENEVAARGTLALQQRMSQQCERHDIAGNGCKAGYQGRRQQGHGIDSDVAGFDVLVGSVYFTSLVPRMQEGVRPLQVAAAAMQSPVLACPCFRTDSSTVADHV